MGTKRIYKAFLFLLMAIIFAIAGNIYSGNLISKETIFSIINDCSINLQVKSIFFGIFIYAYGYLLTALILHNESSKWKAVLAVPTFHTVWGLASAVVLFCRLPYTRFSMFVIMAAILGVFIYYEYRKKIIKDVLRSIRLDYLIIGAAVTVIFSVGLLPIFMTGDSYNFIMKYGIIIANEGALNFSTVGNYMSCTGVTGAFISSLGVFCGIENIQVFHYQIVGSMIFSCVLLIYDKRTEETKKGKVVKIFTLLLAISCPFVYICGYVISNTYFMCFFVIVLIMIYKNRRKEWEVRNMAYCSLLLSWLCMSRIEVFPLLCFILVIVTYWGFEKREFALLAFPMCLFELVFCMNTLITTYFSKIIDVNTLYTPIVIVILLICGFGMFLYWIFYNVKPIVFLRKKMKWISIGMIFVAIAILGVIRTDRYITDVSVTAQNLVNPMWGMYPLTFIIVYILLLLLNKKIMFWDTILWGYILFNFCLCLGRGYDLRLGMGDSFNRMLLGIIPVSLLTLYYHMKYLESRDLR